MQRRNSTFNIFGIKTVLSHVYINVCPATTTLHTLHRMFRPPISRPQAHTPLSCAWFVSSQPPPPPVPSSAGIMGLGEVRVALTPTVIGGIAMGGEEGGGVEGKEERGVGAGYEHEIRPVGVER